MCTQWKDEIKTHAKKSKETVCRIIDVLADINLHSIEEMKNQDIKLINNFQDELETKKLSLYCLLRSTNDIVTKCRDGKLLNDYASLYNTLQNAVKNRLILFAPQFWYGNPIEHKYIEKLFDVVKRREQTSTIGASKIHIDSLPVICDVAELTTKHCFTFEKTHSLFGICENKAWIQHTSPLGGKCVNVYSAEGLELPGYMYNVKLTDGYHMLRATQKELWVQSGALIENITVTYLDTPKEKVRMC